MINFLRGTYLNAFNFFNSMADNVVQVFLACVCVVCIIGIIFVLFLVLRNLSKKSMQGAIFSTVVAVVLSLLFCLPLVLSANKIIKIRISRGVADDLTKIQLQKKNLELENEKLELVNKLEEEKFTNSVKVKGLQKQIDGLKASQISAMKFSEILKLGLLEVELNTKQVWTGKLSDMKEASSINFFYKYYQDEYLIYNTYDIKATFGIDLNKIKIKKINENKIQVYGIEPEYTGSTKNVKKQILKEIREVRYDKDKAYPKEIAVKNDKDSIKRIDELEQKYDREYQEGLQNMDNWKPFNKPIIKLGQNFIKMIFASSYSDIEFVDSADDTFIDMKDYIDNNIAQYDSQLQDILKPAQLTIKEEVPENL